MIVPILNFVMLWVFAFARWPAASHDRVRPDFSPDFVGNDVDSLRIPRSSA
nr:hypothetical protein [Burkholderia ubonensis]